MIKGRLIRDSMSGSPFDFVAAPKAAAPASKTVEVLTDDPWQDCAVIPVVTPALQTAPVDTSERTTGEGLEGNETMSLGGQSESEIMQRFPRAKAPEHDPLTDTEYCLLMCCDPRLTGIELEGLGVDINAPRSRGTRTKRQVGGGSGRSLAAAKALDLNSKKDALNASSTAANGIFVPEGMNF